MSQPTSVHASEIEAILRAARFEPTEAQMAEMLDAYPRLREMLDRLDGDYGFADEPAHAFAPATFAGEASR